MQYICEICNKEFAIKYCYERHINNKNIHTKTRDPDEYEYNCDCGKKYLHQSSLHKHKLQCTQILNKTESIVIELTDQFEKEKQELQEQFQKEREQLELEKQELQKQLELEKQELQKQLELEKQNRIIETQNNLNIQINAFGCENLEHITDKFKIKCLNQIYKSIPEMVAKIHFNTKYPENHNVKIPNKKLQYASIMTKDNSWKTVDKKNTISSIVDKSFNMLDDTYEEHKCKLTEHKRKNYKIYQEKYSNQDKNLHKQLENDIECLVLDGTRKI